MTARFWLTVRDADGERQVTADLPASTRMGAIRASLPAGVTLVSVTTHSTGR